MKVCTSTRHPRTGDGNSRAPFSPNDVDRFRTCRLAFGARTPRRRHRNHAACAPAEGAVRRPPECVIPCAAQQLRRVLEAQSGVGKVANRAAARQRLLDRDRTRRPRRGSETLSEAAWVIAGGPSTSDAITAASTTLPTALIFSHDSHPDRLCPRPAPPLSRLRTISLRRGPTDGCPTALALRHYHDRKTPRCLPSSRQIP